MKKIQLIFSILFLNIFLFANRVFAEVEFALATGDRNFIFNCNEPNCNMIFTIIMLVLYLPLIIFTSTVFFIWNKKGKEEKTFEPVEFNPIKGINFFDIDKLYNENPLSNSISAICATIYEFQNNNYIKIDKTNDNFILQKLKPYDGKDEAEKIFFNSLFDKGDTIVFKKNNNINDDDYIEIGNNLDYRKLTEMAEITKFVKKKYIKNVGCLPYTIAIIFYFIISLIYVDTILPISLLPIIQTAIIKWGCKKDNIVKYSILCTLISILVILAISVLSYEKNIFIIFIIVGYITLILLANLILNFPKRTKLGNEIYQKLRGLALYLEKVEVPRLAITKQENPEYYYKILPYLYILRIKPRIITSKDNNK